MTVAVYGELVGAGQPDVAACLADEDPAKTLISGPTVGGLSERERAASAQEAAKREEPDGYALFGFGSGESSEARLSLMKSSLEPLNAAKPRFMT